MDRKRKELTFSSRFNRHRLVYQGHSPKSRNSNRRRWQLPKVSVFLRTGRRLGKRRQRRKAGLYMHSGFVKLAKTLIRRINFFVSFTAVSRWLLHVWFSAEIKF